MSRTKAVSGEASIGRARELFMHSKNQGKPDYRLVALAIGAMPSDPPVWALEECIAAHDAVATKAATGYDETSNILDEIVRFYDLQSCAFDRKRRAWVNRASTASNDPEPVYELPSLASANRYACRRLNVRLDEIDSAEVDWWRDVRRAWRAEQDNDLANSSLRLEGWKTTHRIDRVLTALYAKRYGYEVNIRDRLWHVAKEKRG